MISQDNFDKLFFCTLNKTMSNTSRKTSLQSLIQALKDLIFAGSLKDWIMTIGAIAIFWTLLQAAVDLIRSFMANILVPLLLSPLFRAAKVDRITQLRFGSVLIGSFFTNVINLVFIGICMFVLSRLLDRLR
jgi:large conductance mechanosensitive channel